MSTDIDSNFSAQDQQVIAFDGATFGSFLSLIDPDPSATFTLQFFEPKGSSARIKADLRRIAGSGFIAHGTIDDLLPIAKAVSDAGGDIHLCPNRTDGRGRREENVTQIRGLFVDIDAADMKGQLLPKLVEIGLPPAIIIRTSEQADGRRYQAVWLVTDLSVKGFRGMQRRLREIHESILGRKVDNKDAPNSTIRASGSLHRKNDAPPQLVIHQVLDVRPYTLASLQEAFAKSGARRPFDIIEGGKATRPPAIEVRGEHTDIVRRIAERTQHVAAEAIDEPTARELMPLIEDMLGSVSSNVPRPEWWLILAALAHLAGGDEELQRLAEAICREWSSGFAADGSKSTSYEGSPLFDEADFQAQWTSCLSRQYTGEPATWRSIRFAAEKNNWKPPQASYPIFAKVEAAKPTPDSVDVLNGRWVWFDDEQVIFDLLHRTTRTREQMADDTAALHVIVETPGGKSKRISAYELWRTSPRRRHLAGRKFLPGHGPFIERDAKGKALGGVYVNLWCGWGCEPVKGDVGPLLALISRLCGGDEAEIRYLTWRIAIKIQKPWIKIPSYVLIVTTSEGSGKSQLGKFIAGIYGKHGQIITDRELESSFDDWKAGGIIFAVSEEVSLREKRSTANRLKAMVTMEVQHINQKGKPAYVADNFMDLYFTANDPDALYIRNERERRPFIVCHDVEPMSQVEAQALQHWYDHGGKEAMLHYLLHEVDGDAFNVHAPAPATAGKTMMAEASRSPAETFVADLLSDAAEDAAKGKPLRDFNDLLTEFVGIGAHTDMRSQNFLSTALTKAGVPRRRVGSGKKAGARKTLCAVHDTKRWSVASNEEWATQYAAQGGRDGAR